MIIPIPERSIFDRASAGTAGSGIAAGGLAAKNSGGSDQSTKFIIGFCVAIPCTLIIVGFYFFFRRRKNKKAGKSGKNKNAKSKNSAWGRRNKEGGFFGKLSGKLRPTEPPAAYKREKELLPSSL
ncbi:transmembrane alpha-helix domain-containing protein [Pochonia chlamydosporia 170]|uniref:Transmembrane alpha-helix domain-containing protein n=1 Tax=Pochonia chlamydosporia 170 TaxID=1380566 RepID=A0A179G0M9_METCM|nr:transmembrane alpha-helix domain-containing protein [Pochonia chlamydosporia 170]OAQ70873.1 transmembrane alpha-helix domain-containing protein [Pochonia chlamydosporia 170]